MCSIRRIDEFLAKWPQAEFGPGHIVLSDANIEDHHLDWCLALLDAVIDGEELPPGEFDHGVAYYKAFYADDDPAELAATREFLRTFRAIPEAERVEPGDELCHTDDWR